ncbi:uncharacterized protein LOC116554513 [Sapajus apella]|uniref:Uncharacterized protein LOC116554513 n=1 Tax=Sapajus apella TaxID=9515 RepID=A0A6J3I7P8_SAPAP|nr:uncharacterized protein LOC116554513 [Sapajus apella]
MCSRNAAPTPTLTPAQSLSQQSPSLLSFGDSKPGAIRTVGGGGQAAGWKKPPAAVDPPDSPSLGSSQPGPAPGRSQQRALRPRPRTSLAPAAPRVGVSPSARPSPCAQETRWPWGEGARSKAPTQWRRGEGACVPRKDTEAGLGVRLVEGPGAREPREAGRSAGAAGPGLLGPAQGREWGCGAAGLAAYAPLHWLRCSSVSAAWPNAHVSGAGTGADAAVSRCCRDAAAGAAALTRGASSSERHRGGAGGRGRGGE